MVGAHQVNLIRSRGRDRFLDILWLARGHTPLASGISAFNKAGDLACESISQSDLSPGLFFPGVGWEGDALFNGWALEFSAGSQRCAWAEEGVGSVDGSPKCYVMVWMDGFAWC